MKKTLIISSAIVTLLLLLTGCGGVQLTPQKKASLKTISIDSNIASKSPKITTRMGQLGKGLTGGAFNFTTGALAGAATGAAMSDEQRAYKNIIENGQFPTAVKNEFEKALKQRPFYAKRLKNSNADATFKLSVLDYGIQYEKLGTGYYSIGTIQAQLIDKKGNVLWSSYGGTFDTPSFDFEVYADNAQATKKAFNDLAKIVVKDLVKNLP